MSPMEEGQAIFRTRAETSRPGQEPAALDAHRTPQKESFACGYIWSTTIRMVRLESKRLARELVMRKYAVWTTDKEGKIGGAS